MIQSLNLASLNLEKSESENAGLKAVVGCHGGVDGIFGTVGLLATDADTNRIGYPGLS